MSRLFGRQVLLQLGGLTVANSYEDFRIRFSVTKTLKSEPNEASIEVYGLNQASIANYLAADRDLRVRLLAGYRGGAPSLLFDGFPVKDEGLVFEEQAAERVLKIKAKDGLRRFEKARVNLTLGQASTLQDVLIEVASSLGLPVDTIEVPPDTQLTQGVTLVGQAADVMDRIALSANADWSIQDGKFQFLQKRGRRRGQGPLLSADLQNYVGTPRRKDKGVEVTAFLQESIVPGGLFRLETKTGLHDGDYKVYEVKYTGDSFYDNDFYAVIQGRPYQTQAEGERLSKANEARILERNREVLGRPLANILDLNYDFGN